MRQTGVLFVCMGNICRSPTAEGVFRSLVEKNDLTDSIMIDSAGTHAYHIAHEPDPRAQNQARNRGIDISTLKARIVEKADFEYFDYILAMDQRNYQDLMEICPKVFSYKVKYFLDFAPHLHTRDLPDPYYGGTNGFERVLDMVEEAAEGFLKELRDSVLSGRTPT